MSELRYGEMLPRLAHLAAFVFGDSAAYQIDGLNWATNEVLIDRNGGEWVPMSQVAFDMTLEEQDRVAAALGGIKTGTHF